MSILIRTAGQHPYLSDTGNIDPSTGRPRPASTSQRDTITPSGRYEPAPGGPARLLVCPGSTPARKIASPDDQAVL